MFSWKIGKCLEYKLKLFKNLSDLKGAVIPIIWLLSFLYIILGAYPTFENSQGLPISLLKSHLVKWREAFLYQK